MLQCLPQIQQKVTMGYNIYNLKIKMYHILYRITPIFIFVFFIACNNKKDTKYFNVIENIPQNDSIIFDKSDNIDDYGDDDLFRFTTLHYFKVNDGK